MSAPPTPLEDGPTGPAPTMDLRVPLGFKLPLDWRTYVEDGRLPAPPDDLYAFLCRAGFAYVEFSTRTLQDEPERALLTREAAACAGACLRTYLHPYTRGETNPAAFGPGEEVRPALTAILRGAADVAKGTGAPVRLVIHPAEARHDPSLGAPDDYRRTLLDRSRAYFAVMAGLCAEEYPQVRPAVEFQMPAPHDSTIIRIGDVSDELLEASAGLPLCLDVGHYLLAVDCHAQAPVPPEALLRRVAAVHLHDVVDGRDHQIISERSGRARACLRALLDTGYAGGVTLEYGLAAIGDAGGIAPIVERSLAVLGAWPA
ncbi:MAG: sugar phosphate isomerase/epimerase [Candidatus Brocadiaceae bacterium]|nr:sugar phosphate isomerase/epimerase [Candidatus Brocadiaceae bacterium]